MSVIKHSDDAGLVAQASDGYVHEEEGHAGINGTGKSFTSGGVRHDVELCSALGWDLDFPRPSSYVSCARPVGTSPYYQFPESQEPGSHGRPAGLTLFRF